MDNLYYEDMLEFSRYHTLMEAGRVAESIELENFFRVLAESCRDPHTSQAFANVSLAIRRNPNEFYKNTSGVW